MKTKLFIALVLAAGSLMKAQDLELDVLVLPTSVLGDNVLFNISVRNKDQDLKLAEGVKVQVKLESGVEFVSYNPKNLLDYNPQTGIWNIGTVDPVKPLVLSIMAKYIARENAILSAEIIASTGRDPDSTPGNGIDTNGNGKIVKDKGDEDDGDAAQIGPFKKQ